MADFLGAGRAARFAGLNNLQVARAQSLDQASDLGRLAGSLTAFERNESTLGHGRTMAAPARFATL